MAGAILNRQLAANHSGVQFAVAEQKHDAEIRRLLRNNPTRGNISVSFTREPDYFADAYGDFGDKQTIVATRGEKVICVGNCLTRACFINGQPKRVGYLGGLRLDTSVSGQFSVLRRGYEFFRELQSNAPADFYFTSIASDNLRARHFLEAGIKSMPKYEFVDDYVTFVLPTNARVAEIQGSTYISDPSEVLNFLNHHNTQLQFAPCWTAGELASLTRFGLAANAHAHRIGDEIAASANMWNQCSFKQTVVHSCSSTLRVARPLFNLFSPLLRQPPLPPAGTTLSHAYLSCLGWNDSNALVTLISDLIAIAARARIQFLVAGFAANSPAADSVSRAFRCRQYRSRIYVVRWPDCGRSADELDHRHIGPEVSLL